MQGSDAIYSSTPPPSLPPPPQKNTPLIIDEYKTTLGLEDLLIKTRTANKVKKQKSIFLRNMHMQASLPPTFPL